MLAFSVLGPAVPALASAPVAAPTVSGPAVEVTDSDHDGFLDAADTAAAAAAAKAKDEKVEDLSQRTESVSVFANPDGSFTNRDFGATVRVKQAGKWTPVDYTLVEQSDGSYAPKASDLDITIGGAGAARPRTSRSTPTNRWRSPGPRTCPPRRWMGEWLPTSCPRPPTSSSPSLPLV